MAHVVSVKVKYIRPQYNNLREWSSDPNNVYIGRKGIVFVDNKRYPLEDSIWANPFKITSTTSRTNVINKYKKYIINKLNTKEISYDLLQSLKGKKLGCWCKNDNNDLCHGDVLAELIESYVPIL